MKFSTLILSGLLFCMQPFVLSSQDVIKVVQKNVTMSQGSQPVYIVKIPEADYEVVLDDWLKIIRQNTKSKVQETEHEYIINGTEINSIINKPINLYSALIRADSSIKIFAAFEIDSVFFKLDEENTTVQNEKTHHNIQNFMKDFAIGQYKKNVEKELSEAEKLLKTKNKELKETGKQIESYQKERTESEQKIKNSEDLINVYENDNERMLTQINNKKESLKSLSGDPELYEQAQNQLKELEKEKKNIQQSLVKEQKNIVSFQSNIEELTRIIEDNKEIQAEKKIEIEKQEDIIGSIKMKLDRIK